MPPASIGGSPRSTNGCDPGSFQSTASALGFGPCEILFLSFTSGVSVSYSPPALLYTSPTGLQNQTFWKLHAELLSWGARCGARTPSSMGRTSATMIILPFVGHLPRGMGPDHTVSLPLLSISLWFLLLSLVAENLFC